jgi:hypothetical protein
LAEVRSAMSECATRFDPARVTASDAAQVVEDAAAIKNMAATVEALAAARVTCAAEGCDSVAFLENDHRDDWAKTHTTVFDLLDRLCPHHHDLKTTEHWALVEGRGKRAFVPPDDSRHPRNAHGPPAAA